MKAFEDLVFEPHKVIGFGTQAKMTFDNGFGVSVVTGSSAYGGGNAPYELAIFGKDGRIDYTTGITEDVLGYLTASRVSEVMQQVQELN